MEILATPLLPAGDRPNADRWNAARSCQFQLPPEQNRCKSGVCSGGEVVEYQLHSP